MQLESLPPKQARSHYRHELRTLTYVTLDEGNGGVIRNLNHEGVAVQAVAPLRPDQRVRLRFELRFPRLRVDIHGRVTWASPSGQCGVRFVDLSPRTKYQINLWIFTNLLDAVARDAAHPRSIFGHSGISTVPQENATNTTEENDGLTLSPTPRPAIRLEHRFPPRDAEQVLLPHRDRDSSDYAAETYAQLDWLYRPISARTLAWMVDGLVVIAALLLFAVVFLSIAHELPEWPLTLSAALAATAFVAVAYWSLFAAFGGRSLGARLAQATSTPEAKDDSDGGDRFR